MSKEVGYTTIYSCDRSGCDVKVWEKQESESHMPFGYPEGWKRSPFGDSSWFCPECTDWLWNFAHSKEHTCSMSDKTVYVLFVGEYSDRRIEAIFSTRSKADAYLHGVGETNRYGEERDIEKFHVDKEVRGE